MILKRLHIYAVPDGHPNEDPVCYTWKDGDDLIDLDAAIRALQSYRDARADALRTALASQQPIEPS